MNCRNLTYLEFRRLNEYLIGDELLDILTKFSPISLTKISLSSCWEYSIDMFKSFLESYRDENYFFLILSVIFILLVILQMNI